MDETVNFLDTFVSVHDLNTKIDIFLIDKE